VVAGAGLALVGIADDVLLARRIPRHEAPLDARRKSRAAAATQARRLQFLDDRLTRCLLPQDLAPRLVAAELPVHGQRPAFGMRNRLEHHLVHRTRHGYFT